MLRSAPTATFPAPLLPTGVLVSCGCYNELLQIWWLKTTLITLHFWRSEAWNESRQVCTPPQGSGAESIFLPFPVPRGHLHSQLTAPSSIFKSSNSCRVFLTASRWHWCSFFTYKDPCDDVGPSQIIGRISPSHDPLLNHICKVLFAL